MCHRLLETDPESRRAWRDDFLKVNAADTAFRLQMVAQASDMHMAQARNGKRWKVGGTG